MSQSQCSVCYFLNKSENGFLFHKWGKCQKWVILLNFRYQAVKTMNMRIEKLTETVLSYHFRWSLSSGFVCVVKQTFEHKFVITWIALDTSAARLHLLMPLLNSLSLSLSLSFIIICTTNCTNRIYVQCALCSHAYFCLSLTKKWHNSCCVSMKMNKMKKPKHL